MPESNVAQCPEPIPYSDESYGYAEIDFTPVPHAVFDNQVKLVPVDKILSNQLGEITQPVQGGSNVADVVGSPILPTVNDSNAKPLLSSYAGAEISLPTTLGGSDINMVSVNDITQPTQSNQSNQPNLPVPANQASQPLSIKPVPMAPMYPPVPSRSRENFENQPIPFGPEPDNNLANFINKTDPVGKVEHFGSKIKEHFTDVKTMDTIVFGAVIIALGYYYVSTYHPQYISNIDVSKIPILSQLNDPNVTSENKIIIVIAIVIGVILVSRMLK